MSLSAKQVRYLWAIGLFKKGGKKATSQQIQEALSEIKSGKSAPKKLTEKPKSKISSKVGASNAPKKELKDVQVENLMDQVDWDDRPKIMKDIKGLSSSERHDYFEKLSKDSDFMGRQDPDFTKSFSKALGDDSTQSTSDKIQNDWDDLSRVTPPRSQSVRTYFGGGLIDTSESTEIAYRSVNNFLRGQKRTSEDQKILSDYADDISKSMRASPKDLTVFRGIKGDFGNQDFELGSTIQDHGFVSTSLNPSHAHSYSKSGDHGKMFRISIPKGHKILLGEDSSMSSSRGEHEVVLDRGSSFRVTGKSKDESSGLDVIDLEIVRRPK